MNEDVIEGILSPTPKKVDNAVLLTFPQAMEEVILGKRVTRIEWNNNESWGAIINGFLMIHLDGKDHQWIVSDGDLLAVDWFVL